MRTLLLLGVVLALAAQSACKSVPIPEPVDQSSAGFGIRITNRAPIKIFKNKPDSVLFVKLDASSYASNRSRPSLCFS